MIRTVKNIYHLFQAFIAQCIYGFPSRKLTLIGVTGTDGKTTTTNLIYHILKSNHISVGMISTVSAKINDEDIDTGFHVTSPGPFLLHKLLRKMVKKNITHAIIEATSHGLHQNRYWGLHYKIAVLTNITHEHLDYHRTYQKYVEAKSILFKHADIAILNRDNQESYKAIHRLLPSSVKILSYSTQIDDSYKSPLEGEYNSQNTQAAASVCEQLGISRTDIVKALKTFPGIVGRMEEIKQGQSFRAIVDFAHTPNALEQVLKTLRSQLKHNGQLIVVFGSAGLRDTTKRPKMGKAACTYADMSVLTAEDPRTEKVENIINDILKGFHKKNYHIEPDRAKAIEFAVSQAKENDIVVVTGKGHEKSMCFGKKEYPWSDKEEIKKALTRI
jgi:UDP-N-acetylmuramoyl-L-alanyl-D-glutamate--2,6-diaminopimelate ligase